MLRPFSMDCLKFKLKFGLKSYFFYFNLPIFKTLTSDSLFSTLFHLNIHYYYFFFLNSQNIFLSYFPPPSPSVPLYISSLFFFLHHPRTTSFLFLFSFFFPTTHVPPSLSFLLLPHNNFSNFINRNLATSAKKKPSNFTNFHRNIQKIIANL